MESHVLLQCIVEAFAKPLNTWYRNEGIVFLISASSAMMGKNFLLLFYFQFTEMTRTFFLLSHLQPAIQLIQFHINFFRHYDPFVTIVYDRFRHEIVSWREISCYRVDD